MWVPASTLKRAAKRIRKKTHKSKKKENKSNISNEYLSWSVRHLFQDWCLYYRRWLCHGTSDRKRNWISKDDFVDLLAISQSAPGILAVNISIFIGYKLRGIRGSLVTALGTVLPSFIIILAIAMFFHNFKDNPIVERIFKGIRPAVVALIAAPTFSMAKSAKVNRYTIWIPVVSALLIWLLGFSPIWIIIAAGVGGFCWGKWKQSHR